MAANDACGMKGAVSTIIIFAESTSHACTICDSAAGSALRSGIFNSSFVITFLQVGAPFLVLGIAIYAIHGPLPD